MKITRQIKELCIAQIFVLFLGSIFAWSKLTPQFSQFYSTYGTFLKFSDCVIPNPFLTACLYGSIAFIVSLFWSVSVLCHASYKAGRNLSNFLLLCSIFAASVVSYETALFYKIITETADVPVTCTPGVAPIQTPCFTGMIFFILAFIISLIILRKLHENRIT